MRRWALILSLLALLTLPLAAAPATLVAWNDLGMHCADGADYSVFAVLPPYNTIHAQLVQNGKLVKDATGITVTYEAVADANGSINKTSIGKTNFWTYVNTLFGVTLAEDTGLAGFKMPGSANTPQAMRFDTATAQFSAEGIPILHKDDAGNTNYFPMMRIVAKNSSGSVIAETHIVLPISDELDCGACHASGSHDAAKPTAGWVNNPDLAKDVKLNILRLHDEINRTTLSTVVAAGTPILCAKCHASNALPGTGVAGIEPLTAAMHASHANVSDPSTAISLEETTDRAACYRCHPGAKTLCLRGVMGQAVADSGARAMECESCHGSMSEVGRSTRQGWLDEPACQNCHTGTATKNSGQIRFTSVFDSSGAPRQPADTTFATNSDTPAAGLSLYRFSRGHGGLECEACHGSTHAEFPSREANDNAQSIRVQGHAGVIAECASCHGSDPSTTNGGPHGLHPLGQSWVDRHGDAAEHNTSACGACHGGDFRGTVLSRTLGDRSLRTKWGTMALWKGAQVSCYACHNGPSSESAVRNSAPSVAPVQIYTLHDVTVAAPLIASDPDGNALSLRIVSQPRHGRATMNGTTTTYIPDARYVGSDSYTVAAWDGSIDSSLATVLVTVANEPRRRAVR